MAPTAHAKTVDAFLQTVDSSLAAFITEKRAAGLSFERVAAALAVFTGGVVDVTGQTIRNWATDLDLEPNESSVAS